jgi:hypothetical protein
MPSRSQAQRSLLAAKFGPEWMHEHHFDNPGRLPAHVKKGKRMAQSDRDKKIAQFVKKRKPSEVSDVRSSNPGTKGVEGARRFKSKAGYQIPYSQDTGRNPYKR